jgi:DUF1707 SHOCT-like domain/Domain of unknown function (DUF4190)
MAQEAAMADQAVSPVTGDSWGRIRAADEDRDRVAGILGTAYSEGRLTKDEYDARLEAAFAARTYGELDKLMTDLPVRAHLYHPAAEPAVVSPVSRTNGFAVASLVCGLGQFLVGPLALFAIVFGYKARKQIRRTGEQGAGLALAGLVLGWGAVIVGILFLAVSVVVATRTSAPIPAP